MVHGQREGKTDVRRKTLISHSHFFKAVKKKKRKTLPFQKFYRYIRLKTPFVLKKNAHFTF